MANILRSLFPVRKTVLTTISHQPEIRQDLGSAAEEEQYLNDLETFLDSLVAQRDRFYELYKLLLVATSQDEAIQKEIDEQSAKDAENLIAIDTVVAKYTTAIKRINRKRTYSVANGRDSSASSLSHPTPVKLPKLQLVSFDGNVLKWNEFWDCFKASVHQNESLSEVDKMNYLKAQLSGVAKEAIAGLASTTANYENAIKTLERRFGNKRVIINGHYSVLATLAPAHGQKDKLRDIFDVIEQHINSLIALGENVENSQMASMIKSKLPVGVVIRLEEQLGEEVWNVQKLRDKIHAYLSIREAAEHGRLLPAKSEPSVKSKGPQVSTGKPLRPTVEALLASSEPHKKCAFCKESNTHWSDECPRYRTTEARKAQIPGHCFNCLRPDHKIASCKRLKSCYYCKRLKHHHSSLCPDQFTITSAMATNPKTTSTAAQSKTTTATTTSRQESTPISVSILAPGESVLLQTASTEIRSPDGTTSAKIRLILDSGSQRTYITKAMAKRLKLQPKGVIRLTLFTFGSRSPKYIDADLVELHLKLVDGAYMTIEAHAIPEITGGFTRVPIDFSPYQSLYGNLPFADSIPTEYETVTPDFLIGLDDYWNIVTAQRMVLTEGLYLIGSKLGWLLTGRYKGHNTDTAIVASEAVLVCARGVTVLSLND